MSQNFVHRQSFRLGIRNVAFLRLFTVYLSYSGFLQVYMSANTASIDLFPRTRLIVTLEHATLPSKPQLMYEGGSAAKESSLSNTFLTALPRPSFPRANKTPGCFSVSGMLSDLTATVSVGGKLEMMRVRATDPRPCPRCGKIYRSAHTLRTHMEDKHTVCTGYRCVLCGTVAKSRNSLHSHMSRQHRGISTKVGAKVTNLLFVCSLY